MKQSILIAFAGCVLISCGSNPHENNSSSTISEAALLYKKAEEIDNEKVLPIEIVTVSGDTTNLSEVDISEERLFLLISEKCCQQCVHAELQRVSDFLFTNDTVKIFLLVNYTNPRDVYSFVKMYKLDTHVFNILSENLFSNISFLDQPLYFELDSSLRIHHPFYAPSKESDKATDNYFQKYLSSLN